MGRFLNADGYVSTGQGVTGNNMFAYCLNNPVNMSDESGNAPKWLEDLGAWTNENIVEPFVNATKPIIDFFAGVYEDCKNYDRKNESEEKVLKANYFSSYKGAIVLKAPIGKNAFSYGFIVLGNDISDINDVKHEYGHYVQFKELGIKKYTMYVAIPSLCGFWSGVDFYDYYSQPWEYGADKYGGVNRDGYQYHPDAEKCYQIYWDYVTK